MIKEPLINLHSFLPKSEVNGPGKRAVFWAQGCNRRCQGCINIEALDIRRNWELDINSAFEMIDFDSVEGITISGGEPFLQASAFTILAEMVRRKGLTVMVYTGYTLEELQQFGSGDKYDFLCNIDILVDGMFEENVPQVHPWAGSGNQKVHFLRKDETASRDSFSQGEIHISPEGNIIYTGIFNEKDYV